MKNQPLPNSLFCIKNFESAEFIKEKRRKATLHSLIAGHALDMSVKLNFQCVHFEKKHSFVLVVFNRPFSRV